MSKHTKFEMIDVELKTLKAQGKDDNWKHYQRMQRPKMIERIKLNFRPESITTPLIGRRTSSSGTETDFIVDGQHQIVALLESGITHWTCKVFESRGAKHEAEVFADVNCGRTNPTAFEKFKAKYVYGDPDTRDIFNILKGFGLKPGKSKVWPSIGAIKGLEEAHATNELPETIAVLVEAWFEEDGAFSKPVLNGVSTWITEAKESDYWDADVRLRLVEKIHNKATDTLKTKIEKAWADDNAFSGDRERIACEVIQSIYKAGGGAKRRPRRTAAVRLSEEEAA